MRLQPTGTKSAPIRDPVMVNDLERRNGMPATPARNGHGDARATMSPRSIASIGVLLAAVGWVYWPILSALVARWENDSRYSHGYLVPLFALTLLWLRRDSSAVRLGTAELVGRARPDRRRRGPSPGRCVHLLRLARGDLAAADPRRDRRPGGRPCRASPGVARGRLPGLHDPLALQAGDLARPAPAGIGYGFEHVPPPGDGIPRRGRRERDRHQRGPARGRRGVQRDGDHAPVLRLLDRRGAAGPPAVAGPHLHRRQRRPDRPDLQRPADHAHGGPPRVGSGTRSPISSTTTSPAG